MDAEFKPVIPDLKEKHIELLSIRHTDQLTWLIASHREMSHFSIFLINVALFIQFCSQNWMIYIILSNAALIYLHKLHKKVVSLHKLESYLCLMCCTWQAAWFMSWCAACHNQAFQCYVNYLDVFRILLGFFCQ